MHACVFFGQYNKNGIDDTLVEYLVGNSMHREWLHAREMTSIAK